MKPLKLSIFCCLLFFSNIIVAQDIINECQTKLSIFHEFVKAKNYDAAFESWVFVKKNCPDLNIAIYIDGEKILKHKLEVTNSEEKKTHVVNLIELWEKRMELYPNKTPKGEFLSEICQLKYDYKEMLEEDIESLYHCFDTAYSKDKSTFTHPKSLYSYFSLIVDLYNDNEKKPIQSVFDKYDDILEKINEEVKNYTGALNELISKEEGSALTRRERQYKALYESYLKNYDLITTNIDNKVGIIADCENLIPLYTKDFDANQQDAIWLKRAVNRMHQKECTTEPLYEKLVKAYDVAAPSADTKLYLVMILIQNGKTSEIDKYLDEAFELESEPLKKSKIAFKIGSILRKRGSYARARNYFRKTIQLNPSNGSPYLAIAGMYASSAKNCGDTNFNKRAVYWLAAQEAEKAARVDPVLRKNAIQLVQRYKALAPSKEEIFKCACSGEVIKIGCWINGSVTVPKL